MIKRVAIALVLIVTGFLAYVASRPSHYVISRQIAIHASPAKIFPYMNNSKQAEKWGPWMDVDPNTRMSYSGPDSGVGSRASWTGGKKLGTGSATIVESVPNQRVVLKLEYTEPSQMVQDAFYLLEPSGDQTIVTWKAEGENSFLGRTVCTFFNMDKMVGGFFEKGLAKLKTLIEATP